MEEGKWKVNVEEVEARLLGKEGKWKVNVEEVEARLLVGGIRCPCSEEDKSHEFFRTGTVAFPR